MATSIIDGPLYSYGNLGAITSALGGTTGVVPDYNFDAGPNGQAQGDAFLDPRFFFQKDQVQGYAGRVPAHFAMQYLQSISAVPSAVSSTNIVTTSIATSGVAMTLNGTSTGIAINIPIIPLAAATQSANINGPAVVTAAMALDFGFALGTTVLGSANVTVGNAADFQVGDPLVINAAGNAAGTAPLLCYVVSINYVTNIITVSTPALSAQTAAAIGTGNFWFPSGTQATPQVAAPTAALPWIAQGPGLFLDPRQGVTRGVQIVGLSAGCTGGTFTVRGWDIYNVPMSQTITVAAGASTGYSTKSFAYIASVTPNFSDLTHNYSVGTSDVFGMHYWSQYWDSTLVAWNSALMTSSTGYLAGTGIWSTSTATTGDTRGTVQISNTGGGSGISGNNVSNGAPVSLIMTGRRLSIQQQVGPYQATNALPLSANYLFGPAQA